MPYGLAGIRHTRSLMHDAQDSKVGEHERFSKFRAGAAPDAVKRADL
jgi:hypothetical protein